MAQIPARTLRPRTVKVTFADDEDVHYITLCEKRRQEGKENVRRKVPEKNETVSSSRRRSLRSGNGAGNADTQDNHLMQIVEEEIPDEFTDKFNKPFGLLQDAEEPDTVAFQTPKKRKSMVLKAQESANKYSSPIRGVKAATPSKSPSVRGSDNMLCTPNRRVSIGGVIGATPGGDGTPTKSALKRRESLPGPGTPKARIALQSRYETPEKQAKCQIITDKTPGRLRTRTRAYIEKSVREPDSDDGDFSSSDDDSFNPSDESSESSLDSDFDRDEEESLTKNSHDKARLQASALSSHRPLKRLTRRSAPEEKEYEISSDAYFETQSAKHITSNNTLSRLKTPRLHQDILHKLLEDIDTPHHFAISQLSSDYRSHADQWLFSLWEGYSILLYGLGSKRHILQTLQQEVLSNCNVLLVNGFFPGITIKNVLEDILTEILDVKDAPSNLLECVELIENIQSKKQSERIYLLVHNLDGATFRNDKTQAVFSYLAQIPSIHLIASIDHINAALLWDQAKLRRFNFVWWDVTTCVPYSAETSYESSLLIQQSGALALSSLNSVFKSLIPNSKKVFLLIAKNQLDNAKNQSFSGISFQDLYWKCRAAFLASSDRVLRALLTEFLDHHLLKQRRGVDGVETLRIPIENGVLSQFFELHEQD